MEEMKKQQIKCGFMKEFESGNVYNENEKLVMLEKDQDDIMMAKAKIYALKELYNKMLHDAPAIKKCKMIMI